MFYLIEIVHNKFIFYTKMWHNLITTRKLSLSKNTMKIYENNV